MDLTKLMQDKEIQTVVTTNFETDSFVKGYHEYKNIWTPKVGETLSTKREAGNLVDKYAVWVKKNMRQWNIYKLKKMESLQKLCSIF